MFFGIILLIIVVSVVIYSIQHAANEDTTVKESTPIIPRGQPTDFYDCLSFFIFLGAYSSVADGRYFPYIGLFFTTKEHGTSKVGDIYISFATDEDTMGFIKRYLPRSHACLLEMKKSESKSFSRTYNEQSCVFQDWPRDRLEQSFKNDAENAYIKEYEQQPHGLSVTIGFHERNISASELESIQRVDKG